MMTEQSPVEAYDAECRRLWESAVDTLTTAAQLDHPQRSGPIDFADFLASVLAAVAANVGSTDRLTVGRPGSWESDALGQLIGGAVGPGADAVEMAPQRTLPVLVPLNVAQLVSEARQDAPVEQRDAMLMHVDDAIQVIRAAWSVQHPAPGEGASDQEWKAYDDAEDIQIAAEDVLRARYAVTFKAYAEAFTAAVHDAARAIGLTAPVEVQADADPEAIWWDCDTINPSDADVLVWHLWSAARDRVPLPRALAEPPTQEDQ